MRHRRAPIDTFTPPSLVGMQSSDLEVAKTDPVWDQAHESDEELRAGAQILEIPEPQVLLASSDPRAMKIFQVLSERGLIN